MTTQEDYWQLTHRPAEAAIVLRWTPATATMTDDDFKDALEAFADLAEGRRASNLLVDVCNFRHEMGEALGVWRGEAIIPRYNRAGIRKFAYVVPGAGGPSGGPGEDFETRAFDSEDAALAWFREDV
jgi:hypothetical protein